MRFFADRLTAPLWLALAARRPREISYLEATPAARLLGRLGALAGTATGAMRFRMVDVRGEDGVTARFRIPYDDLSTALADMLADPDFRRWLEAHDEGRLGLFLAKSAATSGTTDHNRLWRGLYFVSVCAWLLRGEKGAKAELLLERSYCSPEVIRYAARAGLRARAGARLSLRSVLRETATAAFGERGLGFRLRMLRAHGPAAALSAPASPAPPAGAALWATEHWGHLNLDNPELQSDQFFWHGSPLRDAPGLVVFRTPSDPLTAERLAALRARGLGGIAANPASAAVPSLPIFRPTRAPAARAHEKAPAGPLGSWLRRETRRYDELRAFWRELFEREGVKLFLTWYKNDPTHIAVADAMRDAGGVFALYQRSFQSLPTWELTCGADVHFSFSAAQAAMLRVDGSRVRWSVVTGFPGDHRFAALRGPARVLRKRLESAGAKRVVALFDENSADDARWHLGHERHQTNYGFLLEKVLAEPWLGLVIKPKVPRTLRRRLGPLAALLEKAEATGRCFVFGEGALQSSHPPAAAALSADLAVHGHLTAGTAALEAALAGTPTVLYDGDYLPGSPLYRLGLGRCVFRDWPSLWSSAVEHWNRPGGVPGFADWSALLPELDPFRDGRAAERMGAHLAWLREGLAAGLGRERAMSDAAERYAKRWGAWAVTESPS